MKTVDIEVMATALFIGIPSYLEFATGKMMGELNVPLDLRNNEQLYMHLPAYSLAHVKQVYFHSKYNDFTILSERDLNTYPSFPLVLNQEQRELGCAFNTAAHAFIVDHNLEDEYFEFSDLYTIEAAKKFCEDNGIPYRFKYPKNK